jgi:hypothetical protein
LLQVLKAIAAQKVPEASRGLFKSKVMEFLLWELGCDSFQTAAPEPEAMKICTPIPKQLPTAPNDGSPPEHFVFTGDMDEDVERILEYEERTGLKVRTPPAQNLSSCPACGNRW